jgi:RNA polymerase-interacting CarD/CdnL/TRCF family regulator
MSFQVGDKVIHRAYGLGKIVRTEEKVIQGQATNYYVMSTPALTVWVPINDLNQGSLRLPTSASEFPQIFQILASPGEALPEDRVMRKDYLLTQMRTGSLAAICQAIRDLTHFKRQRKLNDQEKSILEQGTASLLAEWVFALGESLPQARQSLAALLGDV